MLADLGASVIKVNALYDGYWFANHMAIAVNRGKRSIAIDLKNPRGRDIVYKLVARADVVAHNMRYGAPERIGVDYETLRAINPRIIYCHTRGFEHGPRLHLPGTDQSGAALAGVEWEDGGCWNGGTPFWSPTSLGDTGNGFLSAIAIVMALYHRERTGQGQKVDAAIINATLLTASNAYITADGRGAVASAPGRDADGAGCALSAVPNGRRMVVRGGDSIRNIGVNYVPSLAAPGWPTIRALQPQMRGASMTRSWYRSWKRFFPPDRPANGSTCWMAPACLAKYRRRPSPRSCSTIRRSSASNGSPLISGLKQAGSRSMAWDSISPRRRVGFGVRRRFAVNTPRRFWPT